jgi:carbamoyltransferase
LTAAAARALAKRAGEFFVLAEASLFMLLACEVRPRVGSRIPAVVRIDGSTRPQTVTRDQNLRLHLLLEEFERLSGVPVLLNTSFNDADEPIVPVPRMQCGHF